jgi:hypothetical protein
VQVLASNPSSSLPASTSPGAQKNLRDAPCGALRASDSALLPPVPTYSRATCVTLAGDPLRVVQRSVLRPTTLNVEPRPSRTSPSAEPTAADSGSALAPRAA